MLTTTAGVRGYRNINIKGTLIVILWQTVNVIAIVVEFLKTIALVMLIIWHIFIMRLGVSTYQFIIEKE